MYNTIYSASLYEDNFHVLDEEIKDLILSRTLAGAINRSNAHNICKENKKITLEIEYSEFPTTPECPKTAVLLEYRVKIL